MPHCSTNRAGDSRRFPPMVRSGRRDREQMAGKHEAALARGAGEQTAMADAVEAAWQEMEQMNS
ncbi:hypothetical protein GCM10010836_55490 [Aminobacter aminovorans]